MDSIKKRLLPLLVSLVLLCSCAAGTVSVSPSASPAGPSAVQVQSTGTPALTPDQPDPSPLQSDVSPSPSAPAPDPSPTPSGPVPEPSPSTAPVSESPVTTLSEEPVEVVVYVTRTGEKYHSDGCQYLSRSQIPISLADAKAGSYTPCSKCHPPR